MLTYIYLDMDKCRITSSQQRFKLQFLSIMLILNKMCFLNVLLMAMLALTWSGCISLCSYQQSTVCMTGQFASYE